MSLVNFFPLLTVRLRILFLFYVQLVYEYKLSHLVFRNMYMRVNIKVSIPGPPNTQSPSAVLPRFCIN